MKSTARFWIVFCLMLLPTVSPPLQGQSTENKLLERRLSAMRKDDTARVGAMLALADSYLSSRLERAGKLGEKALALAQKLRSRPHQASALHLLGRCSAAIQRNREACAYFLESCTLFEQLKDSSALIHVLMDLGSVYETERQYDRATEAYARACRISSASSDGDACAGAHFGIGRIHQIENEFRKALTSFRNALAAAEQNGDRTTAMRALYRLAVLYDQLGDRTKSLIFHQRGLELARELGDRIATARYLNSLGVLYRGTGDYEKALDVYQQCLTQLEGASDSPSIQSDIALTYRNIGDIHLFRGDNTRAIKQYRCSMAIQERIADTLHLAETYGSIGLYYYNISAYDSSLVYQRRALLLNECRGDEAGTGSAWSNMGMVYAATFSNDSALACFTRAVGQFEEAGSTQLLANALVNVGVINDAKGSSFDAIPFLERAFVLYEKIGDKNGLAHAYGALGNAWNHLGNRERALEHYLQCLSITEAIGSGDLPKILLNIGVISQELRRFQEARTYMERSLRLAVQQGDYSLQALVFGGLGDVVALSEGTQQAIPYYQRSLELYMRINEQSGIASAMAQLGYALCKTGQYLEAKDYLRKSIDLQRRIGMDTIPSLISMGETLLREKNDTGAELYLLEAMDLAGKMGNISVLSRASQVLSALYEQRGDHVHALEYLRQHITARDSLLNEKNQENINYLLARFDSERKDQRIALLKRDGQLQALNLQRQREELLRRRLEAERREQDLLVLSQESEIQALKLHDNEIAMRMEKAQRQKTQREAELLQQSDLLKEEKLARQRLLLAALAVGATLLAVIGLLLLRRARAKRVQASLRAEAAEARELVARSEAERTKRKMQNLFTKKLIESQELERRRIAAELHDGLGQELLVIGNQAELALMEQDVTRTRQSLSRISALARNVIMEVRQVSRDLRPIQLERAGLSETLIDTLNRISLATGIRFTSDIGDLEGLLAPEQEIHLFRIVQEGVNNILKHSQANAASVAVTPRDDVLVVRIEDDGRGFALHSHLSKHGSDLGFGLHGMKERVEMLHGDMRIHSAVNRGTTIEVRVPLTIPTPTPREKESIPV